MRQRVCALLLDAYNILPKNGGDFQIGDSVRQAPPGLANLLTLAGLMIVTAMTNLFNLPVLPVDCKLILGWHTLEVWVECTHLAFSSSTCSPIIRYAT